MFRSKPLLEYIGPRLFKVRAPLVWAVRDDLADSITVPVGFLTDLASIPGPLRDRFDVIGHSVPAAILHDHLYATGRVSRAFADELFHVALLACGESRLSAWLMYQAVRMFGGRAYRRRA